MSAGITHHYAYAAPSSFDGARLTLACSRAAAVAADADEGRDPFVRARLVEPSTVARSLRWISDVVRSRHHIPAAMLQRILVEADPILTFGGDTLRVEGFSSCCGIYARADIAAASLDASALRPGTTNVDFNAPMRAALAGVRDDDAVTLEIGTDAVALERAAAAANDASVDSAGVERVVERRVKLPLRWLRGLLEVQAIQRRMQRCLRLDRAHAMRFIRGLPRAGRASSAAWVIPAGRGARLGSAKPARGVAGRGVAVRVAGLSRLRLLESMLARGGAMTVYQDPVTGASAWHLDGNVALTLVLSPETWRGFSGEGQALFDLADDAERLAAVRATLSWQSELRAADLRAAAAPAGAGPVAAEDELDRALAWLATRGLVGFDVARDAWFHRVLPFDLVAARKIVDEQQPRLAAARELVDAGKVTIGRRLLNATGGERVEASVASGDVTHRVRLDADEQRCTCTWFAKHQGERGPCKHVLAVDLALRANAARASRGAR